jgi:hypothetical protein
MANIAAVVKELRQERDRLDKVIAVLGGLMGRNGVSRAKAVRPRMSAAARRRIATAQRARWAAWRAKQKKKAA